jgi:hypothetical protein
MRWLVLCVTAVMLTHADSISEVWHAALVACASSFELHAGLVSCAE